MRTADELKGVTLLGNQGTKYPDNYAPEMLECFDNKHSGHDYVVRFDCPEFTTLCPKTGQPDFGHIWINYIPNEKMGGDERQQVTWSRHAASCRAAASASTPSPTAPTPPTNPSPPTAASRPSNNCNNIWLYH